MSRFRNRNNGSAEVCERLIEEIERSKNRIIFHKAVFGRLGRKPREERSCDDHSIIFPVAGLLKLNVEGTPSMVSVGPEEFFYLQPGTSFKPEIPLEAEDSTQYLLRFDFEKPIRKPRVHPYFFVSPRSAAFRRPMELLFEEFRTEKPERQRRARGLLLFLFSSCLRQLIEEKNRGTESSKQLTRVQTIRLKNYLRLNQHRSILPRELAVFLRLSKKHFDRLFLNTFQIPAREWIMRERINEASLMLHRTSLNITEVAQKIGYKDVFLFSRQFKKVLGHSPRAFRNIR